MRNFTLDEKDLAKHEELLELSGQGEFWGKNDWGAWVWPIFEDGVVLARIIEKFEMVKLKGIKYSAGRANVGSMKGNVKRVLEWLHDHKKISNELMSYEDKIYQGDAVIISEL
jgi:hypothetical protein